MRKRLATRLVVTSLFCFLVSFSSARADVIKDKLDKAKADYASAIDKSVQDLNASFDQQIKALSQTGDLDAVEEVRAQRKAFGASQALPTVSSMRAAVAQYREATTFADIQLKTAYETAIAEYTKAGSFDDAQMIKRMMTERFPPGGANAQAQATTAPSPATLPSDPILDALQKAKQEFVQVVLAAHNDVLAVIDGKAKAAQAKGDLDGYNIFTQLHARVQTEILVPDDVKDTAIRGANAKLLRTADAAYRKLQLAYQTAISAYTKVSKIEEAETVKAEMQDGGWFDSYARQTSPPRSLITIDLLKTIDIAKDTIRPRWRFNAGVLEPAGWDDDHGPWIKIPVSVVGSYELRFRFMLARTSDAIYIHVPIGSKWGMLMLASPEQDFADIDGIGAIHGTRFIPLGQVSEAQFRVVLTESSSVKLNLILNGQPSLSWEGPAERVTNGGPVWSLDDPSCFGIDTKSGRILQMQLQASSDVVKRVRNP